MYGEGTSGVGKLNPQEKPKTLDPERIRRQQWDNSHSKTDLSNSSDRLSTTEDEDDQETGESNRIPKVEVPWTVTVTKPEQAHVKLPKVDLGRKDTLGRSILPTDNNGWHQQMYGGGTEGFQTIYESSPEYDTMGDSLPTTSSDIPRSKSSRFWSKQLLEKLKIASDSSAYTHLGDSKWEKRSRRAIHSIQSFMASCIARIADYWKIPRYSSRARTRPRGSYGREGVEGAALLSGDRTSYGPWTFENSRRTATRSSDRYELQPLNQQDSEEDRYPASSYFHGGDDWAASEKGTLTPQGPETDLGRRISLVYPKEALLPSNEDEEQLSELASISDGRKTPENQIIPNLDDRASSNKDNEQEEPQTSDDIGDITDHLEENERYRLSDLHANLVEKLIKIENRKKGSFGKFAKEALELDEQLCEQENRSFMREYKEFVSTYGDDFLDLLHDDDPIRTSGTVENTPYPLDHPTTSRASDDNVASGLSPQADLRKEMSIDTHFSDIGKQIDKQRDNTDPTAWTTEQTTPGDTGSSQTSPKTGEQKRPKRKDVNPEYMRSKIYPLDPTTMQQTTDIATGPSNIQDTPTLQPTAQREIPHTHKDTRDALLLSLDISDIKSNTQKFSDAFTTIKISSFDHKSLEELLNQVSSQLKEYRKTYTSVYLKIDSEFNEQEQPDIENLLREYADAMNPMQRLEAQIRKMISEIPSSTTPFQSDDRHDARIARIRRQTWELT